MRQLFKTEALQGNQLIQSQSGARKTGECFDVDSNTLIPNHSAERVRQLVSVFAEEWDLGLNLEFDWESLADVDVEMKGLSQKAIDDIARCRHKVKSDVVERQLMLSLLKAMLDGEPAELFQPTG